MFQIAFLENFKFLVIIVVKRAALLAYYVIAQLQLARNAEMLLVFCISIMMNNALSDVLTVNMENRVIIHVRSAMLHAILVMAKVQLNVIHVNLIIQIQTISRTIIFHTKQHIVFKYVHTDSMLLMLLINASFAISIVRLV